MEQYYFLFSIALVYVIFASIQDLRKKEVANWLNFSLLAFALAYRAFYSYFENDVQFFILGLAGFGIFFLIGNAFYYSKIFGGGDVKLLMAIGVILPYSNYIDLIFNSLFFLAVLFLGGAVYSIIYSSFLVYKNYSNFKKEFSKLLINKRKMIILCFILAFILLVTGEILGNYTNIWTYEAVAVILLCFLYIYLKSLESACMIRYVLPKDLTEGDWLEKSIHIKGKTISKSVHGLSFKEINLIRKANKKVLIRYGVPFVPAFLIALIATVFFWVFLKFDFQLFLYSLF